MDLIGDAQESDGYLSTYFQIDAPERKFKRFQQSHELYTMGHYIEAGIAYYEQTGNDKALQIAIRMADCIDASFGLTSGKIPGYDGHPEIEMALSRLYAVTHEQRYLDLAHYFLTQRGQDPAFFDKQNAEDGEERDIIAHMREFPRSYYQAAEPIKDQQLADGHAVRVVYLCTGMAYVARFTGDQELLDACERFWNDIVKRRMYVTGNIGSTTTGESFTYDYDLPNDTMYGETCASVGMAFFARQMLALKAKGAYADVLEKELFNGAISGMSLDGKHFFYVNPLEADPQASAKNPGKAHVLTHRADWFGCACCPANLARLITSVDQYLYTVQDQQILSHQFIANKASFDHNVTLTQTNNFPWDGDIHYSIENPDRYPFKLGIRIPNWSASFELTINGQKTEKTVQDGFICLEIEEATTSIDLALDMSTKFLRSNNRVSADYGKVAVQRGPIVYAAEAADNDAPLWLNKIETTKQPTYQFEPDLLNGVGTVTLTADRPLLDPTEAPLYTLLEQSSTDQKTAVKLIPYYAWANRADGQMMVWLHQKN